MNKADEPYPMPESEISFVGEAAARYDVPRSRLRRALWVVEHLIPEELALLDELSRLQELDPERRRSLARGLKGAVEEYRARPTADPFAEVDEPLKEEQAVAAVLWADLEAEENRARLLRESVSAAEAGRLTGRSRQAVERQRRDGRILALRVGRQWRYPAWQFDTDGPGGLIPCLSEAVALLFRSPAGAAAWLTVPRPELDGDTPLSRLKRRDAEPVLRLAEQLGHLP